jgi:galactose-1-phosphate uridylyltransferase
MQLEERLCSYFDKILQKPADREAFLQRWGNRLNDGDISICKQVQSIDDKEIRDLFNAICSIAIMEGVVENTDTDDELIEEMQYVCGSRRRTF